MVRPGSLVQDEVWFPRLLAAAAVVVGALCAVTEPTAAGRTEVAVATVVIVLGMLAARAWPGIGTPALMVWLFAPAAVVVARDRNEGYTFVLLLALVFVMGQAPSVAWRYAAGSVVALVPVSVAVASDVQLDGWPYWTGGALFTWFSVEQSLRVQKLVDELAATRDRLARQAVLLERRRIAAEMHDLVGHSLSVILLHVTGARRRVVDDPQAAREALAQAEEVGRASLAEMRNNAAALRDEADDPTAPTPGLDDVATLVARMRAAGAQVTFEHHGDSSDVEPIIGLAAYRVVQESLVNAARHAPGAAVRVCVRVLREAVEVEVVDHGGGRVPPTRSGVGIAGMRERVEALGGSLTAGPTGSGWRVLAGVPRTAPHRGSS
ncbi:MAG: histidine kinase [Actinomycetota bacterium]|nr:histidine kinase [Actinomycetota bacterium]